MSLHAEHMKWMQSLIVHTENSPVGGRVGARKGSLGSGVWRVLKIILFKSQLKCDKITLFHTLDLKL